MEASIKDKYLEIYRKEIKDTIQTLKSQAPPFADMEFFMETVQDYYDTEILKHLTPEVIILGTCFPEELVYAAGMTPRWILGGSLGAANWADHMVPRDTDPVSRSMLGLLMNDAYDISRQSLIIIPIINDSMRKIAYTLKLAGRNVHTVDVPPVKDAYSFEKWYAQIEKCSQAIEKHTKRWITKSNLRKSATLVSLARQQMKEFIRISDGKIPAPLRMFIIYSYYCTNDVKRWANTLAALNAKLKEESITEDFTCNSNVLLMGSPVYFPNYKVPFLLHSLGLHVAFHADYTTQKIFNSPLWLNHKSFNPRKLIDIFYEKDCSSAYALNHTLFESVDSMIKNKSIDGVVYHILKGQIEYDFELERYEALFGGQGIPVYRLETDYSYQDIEQLRIRMEAFTEMLSHRSKRKDRYAV